ncbi:MAG: ATP-dependent Clp protease adaptor ClpS [Treponema sp.]|nr:ATP-dependent Clp protease adaptor ClpS [Treponema sp.]
MGSRFLTKLKEKTAEKERIKEPEEYRVVLLNDHYTSMEFVVDVLMSIFHKNFQDASRIMLDVHTKGKGIVGQYTWDIAATKTEQVHAEARKNEFPLRCIVEPA